MTYEVTLAHVKASATCDEQEQAADLKHSHQAIQRKQTRTYNSFQHSQDAERDISHTGPERAPERPAHACAEQCRAC